MKKGFQFIFLMSFFICSMSSHSSHAWSKMSSTPEYLKVASLFKDHMVLQRDVLIPVWGKGVSGEEIEVHFANEIKKTTVNSDGKWMVKLSPLKASFESRDMRIIATGTKENIVIKDVLLGEVWICSGQSNMELTLNAVPEVKKLIPSAKNIRSFKVENTVSFQEEDECEGKWVKEQPNSAVAFSFAYFLEKYANIPVGIILTSWGSSSLEAWMPLEMTETVPHFKTIMEEFKADHKTIDRIQTILDGPRPFLREDNIFIRRQSNIVYNAMMHPLIPYACRGLVWYQGERNTKSMHSMVKAPWFSRNSGIINYGKTLKQWIKTYRSSWENEKMQFLVVMLPGYGKVLRTNSQIDDENPAAHSWAWMRESQLKALELPYTSVINTVDLGDVKNIHPKDKLPIGKRLALVAMKDVFNSDIESYGPIFKKLKIKGNTIKIDFSHDKGLKTNDGKNPDGFWLSDSSNTWKPAKAIIEGTSVVLTCSEIKKPLYVRYAFTGKPKVNLVNGENLPAYPFRTDTFQP